MFPPPSQFHAADPADDTPDMVPAGNPAVPFHDDIQDFIRCQDLLRVRVVGIMQGLDLYRHQNFLPASYRLRLSVDLFYVVLLPPGRTRPQNKKCWPAEIGLGDFGCLPWAQSLLAVKGWSGAESKKFSRLFGTWKNFCGP